MAATTISSPVVEGIRVRALRIPTDEPESDGTLEWSSTTMVIVEARGGGETGLGYTYADDATARLIADKLAPEVIGREIFAIPQTWQAMVRLCRNLGRPGVVSMAIAAVDIALWDLKAKVLQVSLVDLLGRVREAIRAYGSGGFTSYSTRRLCEQLAGWADAGMTMVKMKVGRDPAADGMRVREVRQAIGDDPRLLVDANGAYNRKQALAQANLFAEAGVTWFEEPVSSDDLDGLRLLRDRAPAGMQIAAGEYGYDLVYFERMLAAGAVDVLQADVSRCAGISGIRGVAPLCSARSMPLSAHTVPSVHAHVGCALEPMRHVEYFHDHVRIEHMLLDGAAVADNGFLRPDASAPGLGLAVKWADADPFAIYGSEAER